MTPQEFELVARLFLTNPNFPQLAREAVEGHPERGIEVLADVLRAVAAANMEAAIKAQCPFCEMGLDVVLDGIDFPSHRIEQVAGSGKHTLTHCLSSEIHALRHALEPVHAS